MISTARRQAGAGVRRVVSAALLGAALLGAALPAATAGAAPPATPGGHGRGHGDDPEASDAHHRFEDAAHWAARFENPDRDAWQLPDSVVAVLVTRDDLVVGDIGSATGYFPVRFARALPRGAVLGSDIEPEMVTWLNDRARTEGLTNLASVLATADDPHFPRRVDLVFLCNTYHHIQERADYFRRLRDQLADGARVAVVDYRLDSARGPRHKLDPAIVEREMIAAGYALETRHDFLPEQYFLVFRAPSRP